MAKSLIKSTERRMKFESGAMEAIENIYANAERFHWRAERIREAFHDIIGTDEAKRMPEHIRARVWGAREFRHRQWLKRLVFSYAIDFGDRIERLPISDERYRKVPPEYVSNCCGMTGAHVYRDAPDCIAFGCDDDAKPIAFIAQWRANKELYSRLEAERLKSQREQS